MDTPEPDDPPVVRGSRFELVDPAGRVRAVLGPATGAFDGWWPALALLDDAGHERATVLVGDDGPLLSLTSECGNVLAEFGLLDSRAETSPGGPYLALCEANGAPAWRVIVNAADGSLSRDL